MRSSRSSVRSHAEIIPPHSTILWKGPLSRVPPSRHARFGDLQSILPGLRFNDGGLHRPRLGQQQAIATAHEPPGDVQSQARAAHVASYPVHRKITMGPMQNQTYQFVLMMPQVQACIVHSQSMVPHLRSMTAHSRTVMPHLQSMMAHRPTRALHRTPSVAQERSGGAHRCGVRPH